MRTVTRATMGSSLITRHLQAIGVLRQRVVGACTKVDFQPSNIPCAGRVLDLGPTASIAKCFAPLDNVLA